MWPRLSKHRGFALVLVVLLVSNLREGEFCTKSMNKIFELHRSGRTIVLVPHSPAVVATHCNRCVVINAGKKVFDGAGAEGAEVYKHLF